MKSYFSRLLYILDKNQIKGVLFLFFGTLLNALLDTAAVALMVPFMTLITNLDVFWDSQFGKLLSTYFHINNEVHAITYVTLGFIVLYLLRGIFKILFNHWQYELLAKYRMALSTKLYAYVMRKPYSYHLSKNTAETQRLVNVDVNNCFLALSYIIAGSTSLLTSVGILAVLFAIDSYLSLTIILIISIFVLWVKNGLKGKIAKYASRNHDADLEINKWVSQSIGGIKSILVKRRQDYCINEYQKIIEKAVYSNSSYLTIDMIPKVLIDTGTMLLVFTTILVEILIGNDIKSSLPLFAAFAMAAMRLIPVVGSVTSIINYLSYYRPSLDAVYDVLKNSGDDYETTENSTALYKTDLLEITGHKTLEKEVSLDNISFKYSDSEQLLFRDICLTIPAKKSTAFIGPTGAGKTTLADIVLGLHIPEKGNVYADGIDVNKNMNWWASMVGYVPQFVYLIDDTIRANIAFGRNKNDIDDEDVWDALDRACLKEFVESLPNGLDTLTGENGVRLSGGQRQRLGIARALYDKPQLLVMDEATSSLDIETEKAIVESINMLSGNITLLVIAHRLSTIEKCDIVYKIEDGEVSRIR